MNEEDLRELEIDEKIGGVEIPEFRNSKSINDLNEVKGFEDI